MLLPLERRGNIHKCFKEIQMHSMKFDILNTRNFNPKSSQKSSLLAAALI